MIEVVRTDEIDTWLDKLKDVSGKGRIIRRLDRLAQGNPGDVRPIGRGLSELRLNFGPYPSQQEEGGEGGALMEFNEKYKKFDAADYLKNLDDVAALLEGALEDSAEDPTAVPHALGIIARSQNMSELARRVGMSRDGLYKALSADGNPTWSTILKVTNALGLRFELHSVA